MLTQPTEDRSAHLLYFSRGKGRGHAIPDIAIVDELLRRRPDIGVTFVSYSLGSSTLRELNRRVIDLGLAEDSSLWDTTISIVQLLQSRKDALIVSHEEFAVLPLATAFGLRSVFVTDWFANADSLQMQSLRYTSDIIFLDEPGYYEAPPYFKGQIHYVGIVLRPLTIEANSREHTRHRFGIPPAATVILVVPGGAGFHSEERAPISDLVIAAYDLLDIAEKRLVWVVGDPDYGKLLEKRNGRHDIMILRPHFDFTPTLNAADVVIAKGNRLPLFEAEMLGLPSMSISYGHNPVDDYRVGLIKTNTALRARGLDPVSLKHHLQRAVQRAAERKQDQVIDTSAARAAAAQRLEEALQRATMTRVAV